MKSLFFVCGILFAQYIIPLLDSFGSVILAWNESKKAKLNENIASSNVKIKKITDDEEKSGNPIGFFPKTEKEVEK